MRTGVILILISFFSLLLVSESQQKKEDTVSISVEMQLDLISNNAVTPATVKFEKLNTNLSSCILLCCFEKTRNSFLKCEPSHTGEDYKAPPLFPCEAFTYSIRNCLSDNDEHLI